LRLPVIALIAWAYWGETFSIWVIAGAIVIFTSTYLSIRRETREP
jgi:drug/metabolite transporter (DMT)-like permease